MINGNLVMATYNWDTSLSVGNEIIDDQHKELFNILNSLDHAIGKSEISLDIGDIIAGLEKYIDIHFRTEEDLMARGEYERLEVHLKKHEYFVEKVQVLKRDIEHGRPVSALDLLCFLAKWLRDHIMTEDKLYEESIKGL